MYLCLKITLVLMVLVCVSEQKGSYRRPTRVGLNCCKDVSKAKIPPNIKLTGYKHQNALAPCVDAIIFYTENGKYCSDPNAKWVNNQKKGLKEIQD